jgi:pimeloyl-ACP methyl ester carboxylesterase
VVTGEASACVIVVIAESSPKECLLSAGFAQVPWGVNALGGTITETAWRIKPSWYLVTAKDRMIPPPAQRAMAERTGAAVTEVSGSHSIYLSQPAAVAALITQAATATHG